MRMTPSLLLLTLLLPACGGDKATEGQNAGECTDGADNDADGTFDCDDSDCAGSPDCEGDTGMDVNAAPSGVAITITPEAPGPDDALTCTIVTQAVDPDGDTVSYRYAWTVDGASAAITEATVPSTLTEGGQAWTCTVTPTDGTLDGATASTSVTIVQANRAPSAPAVAIVPEAPSDDDVLNCVITGESVDPDGDTVSYSYSWTVNGASAGITMAIVGAERTSAGETWACSVVASDGELASGAGTASVELGRVGSSASNPARSCGEIRDAGASTGDGTYWLRAETGTAFEAYCDMTTDGGGWTLVYKRGAATSENPHACSSSEVYGFNVEALTSLSVGSSERTCAEQSFMEQEASEMACDWIEVDGDVDTRAVFSLTRDTPWSALTRDALDVSYSGEACEVNGYAGTVHTSGDSALWTCDSRSPSVMVYSVWHYTGCCGGPWTFADAWDFASEWNGRCWVR